MKTFIYIFIGGGLGSVTRFIIGLALAKQSIIFPWKTLVVNVIGCFLLGLLSSLFIGHSSDSSLKLFLTTGFCGGFTTFSTFSTESITLLTSGHIGYFTLYVLGSLSLGLLAAYLGFQCRT